MSKIALYNFSSGMSAQATNVETISNNLANINTTAFKKAMANFQTLDSQNENRLGVNDGTQAIPTGVQIGLGVKLGSITYMQTQGESKQTEEDLDMTIQGNGYFVVQLPNGDTAYTRDGHFTINSQSQITTTNGYILMPAMTVPQNYISITVTNDGIVSATLPGNPAVVQQLGQLEIARFDNPNGLSHAGNNLLFATESSGAAQTGLAQIDGYGYIEQGRLEGSNVNPVNEITSLIAAQRAYELNSKGIQAVEEMLRNINGMKG